MIKVQKYHQRRKTSIGYKFQSYVHRDSISFLNYLNACLRFNVHILIEESLVLRKKSLLKP